MYSGSSTYLYFSFFFISIFIFELESVVIFFFLPVRDTSECLLIKHSFNLYLKGTFK